MFRHLRLCCSLERNAINLSKESTQDWRVFDLLWPNLKQLLHISHSTVTGRHAKGSVDPDARNILGA